MKLLTRAADLGRAVLDDIKVIFAQFGRQDIFFHAGSVAYSALLAGVPFALLLASAIGYLLPTASSDKIYHFLAELLPTQTAASTVPIVQQILTDVEASRGAIGLLGLPLFAWFSTRFFGALRASLGSVFAVDRGHGIIHGKVLDFVYVLVGTLVVIIYLGFTAYLARGTEFGIAVLKTMGIEATGTGAFPIFLERAVATAFLALLFTALYKFLPNRHVHWESAVWGGLWGAALFEVARLVIFEVVTRLMDPASLYSGTLAAIVVLVFWTYYAAVLFLIGGVVARVHELRDLRHRATKADAAKALSAKTATGDRSPVN